jgi:hypothetical protein
MLNWSLLLLVSLAQSTPATSLPSDAEDPLRPIYEQGSEPWQVALREKEPLQLWRQIHWLPLSEALAKAQKEGKPLLLSIMSGALGKAHAPFT